MKSGWLRVSIDASGGFSKTVKMPECTTGYLLLYIIVTGLFEKIVLIQQMLTEKHNTNQITFWLLDGLKTVAPIPNEVVTDGSLALLNDISLLHKS